MSVGFALQSFFRAIVGVHSAWCIATLWLIFNRGLYDIWLCIHVFVWMSFVIYFGSFMMQEYRLI